MRSDWRDLVATFLTAGMVRLAATTTNTMRTSHTRRCEEAAVVIGVPFYSIKLRKERGLYADKVTMKPEIYMKVCARSPNLAARLDSGLLFCRSRKGITRPRGAGGAGFSLWGFDLTNTKPHRLKPAPQETSNHSFAQFFQRVESVSPDDAAAPKRRDRRPPNHPAK